MAKSKQKIEASCSDDAYKKFISLFERAAYSHSYADTFNNFLDFALWMLSPDKGSPDMMEIGKRLESIYKPGDADVFAEMFMQFTHASDNNGEGFRDVLGDLFMDLVSHGHNGQFFTPPHVCDLMAQLTMGEDGTKDGEGEPKLILDPCVGSGRMILAAGKLNRHNLFYGADISETCCKMTVLNMVMNTLCGEVAHMNSLSMEHYKSWHIRKMRIGTHYMPIFFTTGKNESKMLGSIRKPKNEPEMNPEATPIEVAQPKRPGKDRSPLVQTLFDQIPTTDIREALRNKAADSLSVMEKADLWRQAI